jgi:hypothetical protein
VIGAYYRPFQQASEILDAVGVDVAPDVLAFAMLDDLVGVQLAQLAVGPGARPSPVS